MGGATTRENGERGVSGKGDTPRPVSVPQETFAERWERTFGKREPQAIEPNTTKGLSDAA